MTDLEGIGVPDPYQAGLYPGYLWACREMKRAFIKYGVDKVMPLWVSIHDPIGTVMESMLTYKKALDWFPAMCEQGAVGSGSFCGWFCAEMDYKEVIDFSREHDLYCSCALSDRVLLNGPISAIEEEIKQRCEYGKLNPKFAIGIAAVAYLTPISNFEAAIATAKRYGKLWEAQ